MARLELNENESTTLCETLEEYLSDLRMEIVDTDSQDMREDLKRKENCARSRRGLAKGVNRELLNFSESSCFHG